MPESLDCRYPRAAFGQMRGGVAQWQSRGLISRRGQTLCYERANASVSAKVIDCDPAALSAVLPTDYAVLRARSGREVRALRLAGR